MKWSKNDRTNWQSVAGEMLARTANQCKRLFRSVLKLSKKVNHEWTDDETFELFIYALYYGKKWEFIRKNYFPLCTADQIRQKYIFILSSNDKQLNIYERIMNGTGASIGQKQLIQVSNILARLTKIDLAIKCQQDSQSSLRPFDLMVINVYNNKDKLVKDTRQFS